MAPPPTVSDLYDTVKGFGRSILNRTDSDWCDKLHHTATCTLLMVSCLIVTGGVYLGDPITCWLPGSLHEQSTFIHDTCWVSNTYWLPWEKDIPSYPGQEPDRLQARRASEINYYQWVPAILILQALGFYVPYIMWRVLHFASGVNVHSLVDMVRSANLLMCPVQRRKHLLAIHKYMRLYLITIRGFGRTERVKRAFYCVCCLLLGKSFGNWLFPMYVLMKVLFLVNLGTQLLFITHLLGFDHMTYGMEIAQRLVSTNNGTALAHVWQEYGIFPRVTQCDFLIRVLGNLQRHTVQCVLPLNLLNVYIFGFLWLWFWVLGFLTLLNLAGWLGCMLTARARYGFIKRRLVRIVNGVLPPRAGGWTKEQKRRARRFIRGYLHSDGVYLLQLILQNTSQWAMEDLLRILWLRRPRGRDGRTSRLESRIAQDNMPFRRDMADGPSNLASARAYHTSCPMDMTEEPSPPFSGSALLARPSVLSWSEPLPDCGGSEEPPKQPTAPRPSMVLQTLKELWDRRPFIFRAFQSDSEEDEETTFGGGPGAGDDDGGMEGWSDAEGDRRSGKGESGDEQSESGSLVEDEETRMRREGTNENTAETLGGGGEQGAD